MQELIDRERLAAWLVCVIPEVEPDGLGAFAAEVAPGLDKGALFAHDPGNSLNISLQNIFQAVIVDTDGKQRRSGMRSVVADAEPVMRAAKGWRYPREGLTDPRVLEVWWQVERGRPGAVKAVQAAAKKSPEVEALLTAVTTTLTARQDELIAALANLATLEQLEALVADAEGIELKPASERIKVLLKDPALKDELKARSAYRQCQKMLASKKPKEQQAGRDGMAQLAAKMGGTVYGKRAASIKP